MSNLKGEEDNVYIPYLIFSARRVLNYSSVC